ncbi:MAG: PSD1 domain-containing protein [Planctomyces sp.]|nr:PSD1 domain-containing protein [Planctomyces sp.]
MTTSAFDRSWQRVLATCGCLALIVFAPGRSDGREEDVVFSRDVLPLLSDNCFVCHGPDEKKRQGDLRLDLYEGAAAAIDISAPEKSLLIKRIYSTDPDLVMPPHESGKQLTPQQKQTLQKWIEQGAKWGRHWAFEPLVSPNPPNLQSIESIDVPIHNAVDVFVRQVLKLRGLAPSAEADRRTLIRRVSLDLTGLPPSPAEVQAFLADQSPDAWEKVVDRLLQSPHFGERFAWDWLDAARYADSNGYQGDGERTMWPWRDWVVQAFNSNLRFDDFTVWQLAGDLLPDATDDQRLATAFCRNHMINGEGGRIPEENRVDYVMDMTETMGTVWLGLTLNCCRCHDHKFDPLTQKNYFQFFAYFNQTPIDGSGGNPQTPPVLQAISTIDRRRLNERTQELAQVVDQRKTLESELLSGLTSWEDRQRAGNEGQSWKPASIISASAEKQKLTVTPDGRVLASGENPAQDNYSVVLTLPSVEGRPYRLTALRFDALTHPTMTAGGLSRSDSGNFVLTEIRAELQISDGSSAELRFQSARATFEQGALTAASAIDGRSETGWAVYEGRPIDRDHSAIFLPDQPVTVPADAKLNIRLEFQSPHAQHNAGYFQFAVTEDPEPALPEVSPGLMSDLETKREDRTAEQLDRIRNAYLNESTAWKALKQRESELKNEVRAIRESGPKVMVMEDRNELRPTFILNRGLYNEPTAVEVQRELPESISPVPKTTAVPDTTSANRLQLARWLVSETQPLTARVIVNRYWQQLFGIGLVKTSEDFGVQSEYPPHKDLLDWLAADFRDSGWDLRRLLKTIVMSHTYRQSSVNRLSGMKDGTNPNELLLSEIDPENRLLARGSRFRLPSWMLRDQALAVSGLLNREVGGPPVNTYQPEGVWEEATFGNKKYVQDKAPAIYRRSLYVFWRRIIAPTMFFDNASRQTCTVKIFRTNTPLHSLLTMNETTYIESSRVLAEQILVDSALTSDEARIDALFERILSRPATIEEKQILLAGISGSRRDYLQHPDLSAQLLQTGESPRNETIPAEDHAAWTNACLAVLNLDEALSHE